MGTGLVGHCWRGVLQCALGGLTPGSDSGEGRDAASFFF